MDRESKNRWDWLPQHMPGVARKLAEMRKTLGSEHVNLCWRRGVVEQQPGWFYAAEGALAVGTPWADDPGIALLLAGRATTTQVLVVLRTPEAAHGAQ